MRWQMASAWWRGSLAWGAFPPRMGAESYPFQGLRFFERQADLTCEGKGLDVISAALLGFWR
jgi:hypothetical protein